MHAYAHSSIYVTSEARIIDVYIYLHILVCQTDMASN